MHQQIPVPPFAHSDDEIAAVEGFAYRRGLDQIVRLCGELRTLRVYHYEHLGQIAAYQKSLPPTKVLRVTIGRPVEMTRTPQQLELDFGGSDATEVR